MKTSPHQKFIFKTVRNYLSQVAHAGEGKFSTDELLRMAEQEVIPKWQRMGWFLTALFRETHGRSVESLWDPRFSKFLNLESLKMESLILGAVPIHGNGGGIYSVACQLSKEHGIYIRMDCSERKKIPLSGEALFEALVNENAKICEIGFSEKYDIFESYLELLWNSASGIPIDVSPWQAIPWTSPKYWPLLLEDGNLEKKRVRISQLTDSKTA